MAKVSLEKEKIKILLLEGLHPSSVEVLQAAGYTNIEYHKGSLSESWETSRHYWLRSYRYSAWYYC